MAFLTERKLDNTLDLPINLPATEIKMGDWVVIATIRLSAPSRLTFRMLHLNFISSTFGLDKIRAQNRINANGSFCYTGLYFNYSSGDPGSLSALDIVKTNTLGLTTRTSSAIVRTEPGTYSWIAVNNIQWSDQNALLTIQDSADFRMCITGQCRMELDQT
jgi:hypothetical protein